MILQALVRLYNELCKQGKIAEEGWGVAKVSYRIILREDGSLKGIISTKKKVKKEEEEKGNRKTKEIEIPSEMIVPLPVTRSVGIRANFLCDGIGFFFGIDDKGKPARAKQCFEAAKEKHHQILDGCESKAAKAVLNFFDTWDVNQAAENPIIKENWEDIKKSNFIFQVDGKDVLDDNFVREAWNQSLQSDEKLQADRGICLVTGKKKQPISLVHSKIKGVQGAKSSGAALVSFNTPSFCSYGYDGMQGKNAPISKRAAFAYTTALNYLLADRNHTKQMGDTTVVYWSEHAIDTYQDLVTKHWSNVPNGMNEKPLNDIMNRLQNGLSVSLNGTGISPNERFYVLGLSPSVARISVRFFLRNTFGEIMRHMANHQERMKLAKASGETGIISLQKVVKAVEIPNAEKTSLSPLLTGSLMRSVLQDTPYPESLFQHVMMRIFADNDQTTEKGRKIYKIGHVRAAFIKAYLLKNRVKHWEGQIQMAVNENCTNIAYVLGRLFSVLENVQEKANPGINTTIKERYFNGACATPAMVFPTLLKLSNAHMGKLEAWQTVYFNKKLGALMEKISMPDMGEPFPTRLSLEEQGAFVLGYYQETQRRFEKKEDK